MFSAPQGKEEPNLKTISEMRSMWSGVDRNEAVSRALFLAFWMRDDLQYITANDEDTVNAVNRLALKMQIIANLLTPYGDEDTVSEDFKRTYFDEFYGDPRFRFDPLPRNGALDAHLLNAPESAAAVR